MDMLSVLHSYALFIDKSVFVGCHHINYVPVELHADVKKKRMDKKIHNDPKKKN